MENQPLVSVVVPVFNAEKHLKNCVNSICSQSYRNLEILLVDDGSVDNSLALCHSLAKCDKRIKVFDQPNSGAASARNKGLDETVGDCVLFVDSDDTISPTHIEALMDYAQEDIVSTSFVQNWANEINVYSDRESYGYGREAVLEYYGALDPLACGSSCNKLFHKDIIDNYSLRFLTHQSDVGEDLIFVWSYLLHCRSYRNIDNRSYNYIENPSSLTHKKASDATKEYIARRLSLFGNLVSTLQPIRDTGYLEYILFSYHAYFSDTVVRNTYLYNNLSRKERFEIINSYRRHVTDAGYKYRKAAKGIFNKLLMTGVFMPFVIGDIMLGTLFAVRRLIGR